MGVLCENHADPVATRVDGVWAAWPWQTVVAELQIDGRPPRWRRANRSRSRPGHCRGPDRLPRPMGVPGQPRREPEDIDVAESACMESGLLRKPPGESGEQHDLAPAVALLKHFERRTHISQREGCGDRHFQVPGGNQRGELRKDRSV